MEEKSIDSPPESRLQTPIKAQDPKHGLIAHFRQDVRPSVLTEIQLLILTFCTGIQDAVFFPNYHCFASNQTGNTVFLCLALIIPSLDGTLVFTANIAISLFLFLLAAYLTGQLGHILRPRRRWFLTLCNLLQSALVLAAAGLQWRAGLLGPPHLESDTAREQQQGRQRADTFAVIALLAFASGSQVVQSRSLAATEISTAMATAAWVDLVIDPRLWARRNRPRTRRVGFLLALVVGSLVGAVLFRTVGTAVAMAVSGVGKALVTVVYVFVGGETGEEERTDTPSDAVEA